LKGRKSRGNEEGGNGRFRGEVRTFESVRVMKEIGAQWGQGSERRRKRSRLRTVLINTTAVFFRVKRHSGKGEGA